ncbi:MAG: hypothetical protein Kapaf2KO_01340 [Candidatus Kapaibacteriales bacterium]
MVEPIEVSRGATIDMELDGDFIVRGELNSVFDIIAEPLAGSDSSLTLRLERVESGSLRFNTEESVTIYGNPSWRFAPYVRPDDFGSVYPNPIIGNSISLEFYTDIPSDAVLTFLTLDGRELSSTRNEITRKGPSILTFQVPEKLASANYNLRISTDYGNRIYIVAYRR